MSGFFENLFGTSSNFFKVGLRGVRLKNSSETLVVRNTADSADANVTVAQLKNSADSIEINSDAADTGTDRKLTLAKNPAASAALIVQFPAAKPTEGQAIRVKAGTAGTVLELEGYAPSTSTNAVMSDTTTVAHNTSSPATMFQLPTGQLVDYVDVFVDTAFDGTTPTGSVGIAGNTSKYVGTTDIDLGVVGQYRVHPGLAANGTAEDLIFTLSVSGASAGSLRVVVYYSAPT